MLAHAAAAAHAQALVAPVAPETITRDASGERAIVRFVKPPAPLQLESGNGKPATEKTEVWLAFAR